MVLVHEVKFVHPESGRTLFLGRRETKSGKLKYTLKMKSVKGAIYSAEELHPEIRRILGEIEPYYQKRVKVEAKIGGGVSTRYPVVKIPKPMEKRYDLWTRKNGMKAVAIPVSEDDMATLERITWDSRVRQGIRAFFDWHDGERLNNFDRHLMDEHRREISRTVLLVLDRYRTGESREEKYTGENIGPMIDFQAEDTVMKAIAEMSPNAISKLADTLNSDDTMRLIRRKHNMGGFTIGDLKDIKNLAEGMQWANTEKATTSKK